MLPCRHMCLCMECSQIVRRQSNNCPICRTKVSTFIQIKDDQQHLEHSEPKKKPKLSNVELKLKQQQDSKPELEGEESEEEDIDLEEGKQNN